MVKPATVTPRKTPKAPAHKRRRTAIGEDRERQIIQEAVNFFADVGFGGQTRELSKRLGITQPALYRYFPTKDALIERVYQEVFLRRWNPHWETLLANNEMPIAERLQAFYLDYAQSIMERNWIRITMLAALSGNDMTRRYVDLVGERIIVKVCQAVRTEAGLPKVANRRLPSDQLQLVWNMHGSIIYLAIRKYIYGFQPIEPLVATMQTMVEAFLQSALKLMTREVV